MTEIVLTGTGYPRPNPDRAGPGVLVRRGDCVLQFDAGRATTLRLAALGVSCRDLSALFVTHHHSDHLVDLPDVVLTRWTVRDTDKPDRPLPIVVPEGPASRFVERLLEAWREDIDVRVAQSGRGTRPEIDCRPFACDEDALEVWNGGGLTVFARQVRHEPVVPAVAYRVESDEVLPARQGCRDRLRALDALGRARTAARSEALQRSVRPAGGREFERIQTRPRNHTVRTV